MTLLFRFSLVHIGGRLGWCFHSSRAHFCSYFVVRYDSLGSMTALTCIDRSFGHPREHRSVRPYTTSALYDEYGYNYRSFMYLLNMSSQQSSPTDELVAHSNSPITLHPSDNLMRAESASDFLEGRLHITSSHLDQKRALQQVFKSLTT